MTASENILTAALREIAALAPSQEPDIEDYDDTESASSVGVDVGHWEAAEIARRALNWFNKEHIIQTQTTIGKAI